METRTETPPAVAELFNPMTGWQAAARWNRATFDWMAKGWQQWLALVTTVPPHFLSAAVTPASSPVTPAQPGPEGARAMASTEPRRATRAKPKTKSNKAAKARTRSRER